MNLERHFYASGLHRQGYTLQTALKNPALAKALALCERARERQITKAAHIQKTTWHNKGAQMEQNP